MKIQSYSDIITNSSSELFVFNDKKSVDEVIETLNNVYPEWMSEYYKPIKIEEAGWDDIETYADRIFPYYFIGEEEKYYCEKHDLKVFDPRIVDYHEFDKNDCYARKYIESLGEKPEKIYINWETYNPLVQYAQYAAKDPEAYKLNPWLSISDYGLEFFKSLHKGEILLFSIEENPNYKYQDILETIAKRYHLG